MVLVFGCTDDVIESEPLDAGDSFLYIPPDGMIDWCERIGAANREEEPECLFYRCEKDLSKEEALDDPMCSDYMDGNMRMGYIRK